jgi:ribonuclease HII
MAMACGARLERRIRKAGFGVIAGTDEVGRGSLAGPVVAAAVILCARDVPRGIDDSKKLTRLRREALAEEIRRRAIAYAIARVEHDLIDRFNIHRASLFAMESAVKALQPQPDYVLIDGRYQLPEADCPQEAVVKGDSISISIAAASILAKVSRDLWMREYDREYPGYGFGSHCGYNTREHQEAIARMGPCAIHRVTFQGVLSFQHSLFQRGVDGVMFPEE